MRTLAAGNKACPHRLRARRRRGFTLVELLVVLTIVGIASAGVALAMRDSSHSRLEREALRLAALLDAGRAQSRLLGVPVVWRSTPRGFRFDGLPPDALPVGWLDRDTTVPSGSMLELGPEPIIAPQSITLGNLQAGAPAWRIATDGLHPFTLQIAMPAGEAAIPPAAPP